MKKTYEAAELEVTAFEAEDVITPSMTDGGNAGDFSGNGDIQIP